MRNDLLLFSTLIPSAVRSHRFSKGHLSRYIVVITCSMTTVFDSVYWKMPVLAQKFMGVWPYKNECYDKFMRVLVYVSLYMLIIPLVSISSPERHIACEKSEMMVRRWDKAVETFLQGIRLYEEMGVHADIAIENLVGEMYLNAGVIKFSMAILNRKKVRYSWFEC